MINFVIVFWQSDSEKIVSNLIMWGLNKCGWAFLLYSVRFRVVASGTLPVWPPERPSGRVGKEITILALIMNKWTVEKHSAGFGMFNLMHTFKRRLPSFPVCLVVLQQGIATMTTKYSLKTYAE